MKLFSRDSIRFNILNRDELKSSMFDDMTHLNDILREKTAENLDLGFKNFDTES